MDIKAVEVLIELKTGSKVWHKGEVFYHPEIPAELIVEAKSESGTVRIYKDQPEEEEVSTTKKTLKKRS